MVNPYIPTDRNLYKRQLRIARCWSVVSLVCLAQLVRGCIWFFSRDISTQAEAHKQGAFFFVIWAGICVVVVWVTVKCWVKAAALQPHTQILQQEQAQGQVQAQERIEIKELQREPPSHISLSDDAPPPPSRW